MSGYQYIKNVQRKKEMETYKEMNFFRDTPLEVACIEDGYILPPKDGIYENWQKGLSKPTMGAGGVVDAVGEYVDFSATRVEHLVQLSALTRDRFGGKYDFDKEAVTYRDEEVIYCGIFWKQWGHFLIDQIVRLWYVIKNTGSDSKLVWLTGEKEENPIKGNYLEIIKLLGIDENRFEFVREITKFKKIIVPEPCFYPGRYYTNEYVQMLQCMIDSSLDKYEGETYKKIYFSRTNFSKNSIMEIGEQSIENIFRENGYRVLYPEKLKAFEMIAIVNQCEVYASMVGTVAHNAIFASEGMKQIIINRNRIINPFQFQISTMKQIEDMYIDAWEEPVKPISLGNQPGRFWEDPCFLSINDMFKRFCKDNKLKITFKAHNLGVKIRNNMQIRFYYFKVKYLRPLKKYLKGKQYG